MHLLPLIMIPVLFLAVVHAKPYVQPRVPWNVCAMCASVAGTWSVLLIAWLWGADVSPLVIGILIGMSLSGAVYKLEPLYARRGIRNFWFVRMTIVVAGFYGAYLLLTRQWGMLVPVAVFGFLAAVIASFLFQGTTHADAAKEVTDPQKRSMLKKLDNCC